MGCSSQQDGVRQDHLIPATEAYTLQTHLWQLVVEGGSGVDAPAAVVAKFAEEKVPGPARRLRPRQINYIQTVN